MDDFDLAEKILIKRSASTVYVSQDVTILENKKAYNPRRKSLIGFDDSGKAIF
jgi:hypothetical protein